MCLAYQTGYEYDGDANLTLHSVKTAEGILAENRYAYDGNGNITAKSGLYGEYRYSYDELNRLTEESFTRGQGSLSPDSYTTRFTYDGAGNRITMEQGGISHLYTYDNCNRLIHEQAGDSSITYTYDVCGNLTTDGSNTYSYDELNRLSMITTENGHVQRNRYDAEGLRAEMEEDGRLVQFIYNHKGEVITEESGEAGLLRYIRGLGIVSSDSEQAKTYYHYVCDYAGSTSHVLNEQGEVENAYLYDAFGNITASREKVANRFCYTGEQYDRIPNQYYLRARYYNPVIGRFTQQDTYLGAGLNLYAYCNGNPLSYVDPSGHEQQSAGDNAQDYTNLPSVQRVLEKQINAENKYYDNNLNAMAKVLDGEAPSQTNALMVVSQPGDLVPVVYKQVDYGEFIQSGGDDSKPVATQPTAPAESYNATPYRNDAGTDSGTNPLDTAQRSAVAEAVSDAGGESGTGSTLFDTFGVQPGRNIDLANPSAPNNRSYITYVFRNQSNEIVYVGRASGNGNPIQVMEGRISKGHDHFKAGYSYEIVATQTNKLANQGAEEFFILGYQEMGMKLENITPSLSYRSDRVGKTMNKIEAFFEDLFR